MIKISELEKVLNANAVQEVLAAAMQQFGAGIEKKSKVFILDFLDMPLTQNVVNAYMNEGLAVLNDVLTKKKVDINTVPQGYVLYTGLLNREVVVGLDTTKTRSTALYTKSELILKELEKRGAFEDAEGFAKSMGQLFGNKVANAFDKQSLAFGRLDIVKVLGDEVELKLTVPKFRQDHGTTFTLYPYTTFSYLANELQKFSMKKVNGKYPNAALTIMQAQDDGGVKERKVTFSPDIVKTAYSKCPITLDSVEEFQGLLENKIAKGNIKWDALKIALRGYNLESSLYSVAYTVIRLENIVSIEVCKPKDLDMTQALVDYDDLRSLFRTRVNAWKLADYQNFRAVDTNTCANMDDRKAMINNWVDKVEDKTLYKLLEVNPALFGDVKEGLATKYRMKPKAEKNMKTVVLSENADTRVKEVKDYLKRGICKIEATSSKSSTARTYTCTTNDTILKNKLGANYALKFESTRQKIDRIKGEIESGKITNFDKFADRIYKADLSVIVPINTLSATATIAEMLAVLEEGRATIKDKAPSSNPYIVNFKRTNAETIEQFYGAVDVRNIESMEFGEV